MAVADINTLKGQYPQSWSEYVGQDEAKYSLRLAAKASRLLGEPLPHILITSPHPGIGKTALALLTIRASQRPVHFVSGALTVEAALNMFADAEDGDVCFYDEFHKVMDGGRAKAEWMLNYLIDGVVLTPEGAEEVPRVTFVGATTDEMKILPAIRDRFQIVRLDPYSDDQAAAIAVQMSAQTFASAGLPAVHIDTARTIAGAANNQPRQMRHLLVSLRNLAVCREITAPVDGAYDMDAALAFAGVTHDGLSKDAQNYLILLKKQDTPVSEVMLKSRLALASLEPVERILLDKRLMVLTTRGRRLTIAGSRRATALLRAA